jgi:hypothetical protein
VPQEITPQNVTKPIQLLAAWLVGLILVDSSFLAGAKILTTPPWIAATLVVAAVANVPLFLICIFVLQTRFRPEMQEDSFYARYLEVRNATGSVVNSGDEAARLREVVIDATSSMSDVLRAVDSTVVEIRSRIGDGVGVVSESEKGLIVSSRHVLEQARQKLQWSAYAIYANDHLKSYSAIVDVLDASGFVNVATFGASKKVLNAPKYSVISLGKNVPVAMLSLVVDQVGYLESWYIALTEENTSVGNVYLGSYGYGGKPVARLTSHLRSQLASPSFSRNALKRWLEENGEILDVDYPIDEVDVGDEADE